MDTTLIQEPVVEQQEKTLQEEVQPRNPGGRLTRARQNQRAKYIMLWMSQGKSREWIAKRLGLKKVNYLDAIMEADYFKKKFEPKVKNILEAVREVFEANAYEAASKIVQLAHHGTPQQKLQLDAAKEVLYQIGAKPVDVIETKRRDVTQEEIESSLHVIREIEVITKTLESVPSKFLIDKSSPEVPTASTPPARAPVEAEVATLVDSGEGAVASPLLVEPADGGAPVAAIPRDTPRPFPTDEERISGEPTISETSCP
jgi:hypothetical protein